MNRFRPYKALASINSASPPAARGMFAACSSSPAWAEQMTGARPFAMLEDLYRAAELAWFTVAATELVADLDPYTVVEQRLDAMLEGLGREEALEAEASGAAR